MHCHHTKEKYREEGHHIIDSLLDHLEENAHFFEEAQVLDQIYPLTGDEEGKAEALNRGILVVSLFGVVKEVFELDAHVWDGEKGGEVENADKKFEKVIQIFPVLKIGVFRRVRACPDQLDSFQCHLIDNHKQDYPWALRLPQQRKNHRMDD